jgi:fructose-specific phosphotransferase system IIA component
MVLKVSQLLTAKAIMMDIDAREKIAAIKEMVDYLAAHKLVSDGEAFMKALAKRENLESTGIGDGIAIPHARTSAVTDLLLAFARSQEGVDFSSIDGKPSHLIFLIASPEDKKSEYIMALAKISRLLRRQQVRDQLKRARDAQDVLNIIQSNEE